MKLSEIERGSKISVEVLMPDGQMEFITARKIGRSRQLDAISVCQLHKDGRSGMNILLDPSETAEVIEQPHADGDFSYLCGSEYCRCKQ